MQPKCFVTRKCPQRDVPHIILTQCSNYQQTWIGAKVHRGAKSTRKCLCSLLSSRSLVERIRHYRISSLVCSSLGIDLKIDARSFVQRCAFQVVVDNLSQVWGDCDRAAFRL